ncbi:MAG: NUDIX hydrolase [Candidatus Thermoplasmatota archaeon]|jgi:ADP-ribose pyrophosphatase YjhB (NUDIX family)|uniref:NUDIX hydrolase n=1 Tax=Ferroplasma sp. TaxID=2591003 RepID=UPI002605DC4D|nr:NUDIX hydrolase [Ferroplasma sp.]MCL4312180.1 NUDIX hydrolase [Candidatus Thermoplasmatota archaeon]
MECMAAVALILNGNKFLLIKRADQEGDPWSGHMALPGGHRENGETCEQAAIRETMEETGLSVTVNRLLGLYHTLNGHVSVAAYECISSNTEVHPDNEISQYFWSSEKDLLLDNETYRFGDYVVFGLTYRILRDYFS